jgi:hypothetical protein
LGPDTTFFSYARSDSDFVLKLATDLRKAGADIWLDQLDIKSGSRWDLSVETALKDSSKLLIILSPASVSSNNVMDEVSFALEEGKTVIPILFKSCEIPFRLRRLQHADFTKNYDEALANVLQALNLGKTNAIHGNADSGKTPDERPSSKKDSPINTGNEPKSRTGNPVIIKNKYKIPVISAGIILVLVVFIWIAISGRNDDRNLSETELLAVNPDDSLKDIQLPAANDSTGQLKEMEVPKTSKEVNHVQTRTEIAKPVKNESQKSAEVEIQKPAGTEIQKPVTLAEKRIDLSGSWITDENQVWKLVQTGEDVEITKYDKMGSPIVVVEANVSGNILSYKKVKSGNDIEGQFIISADGRSLDGMEKKIAGMKNRLKITRKL